MQKNPMTQQAPLRNWPDLSFYQLHFGIVNIPGAGRKLVLIDETESYTAFARQLGFKQSRWAGLWVRDSLKFTIPGFSRMFPKGKIEKKSDEEIFGLTNQKVLSRQDRRLSAIRQKASVHSWHPNKLQKAVTSTFPGAEEERLITPAVAIKQSIYLGANHLGHAVYENGDGTRHTVSGTDNQTQNLDDVQSPVFLRAETPEDLRLCAMGLVKQIQSGRNLHSEDFERYLDAIFGDHADPSNITRFHQAIDDCILSIIKEDGLTKEAYEAALRLHDGRPSYWREPGSHPTPTPIGLIMQSILSARLPDLEESNPSILDISKIKGQHSWQFEDAICVSGTNIPPHSMTVAGIYSHKVPEKTISGIKTAREDHQIILNSLNARSDRGVSVFLIAAGNESGRLEADFKRILSRAAEEFEILGLIDIDPRMLGSGNTTGSRLLVVGNRKAERDYAWTVPQNIDVIYDYDNLWNWSETIKALEDGDAVTFGQDDREENRWQSPYIPSSQISEPKGMSPRNLLAPVRRSIAKLIQRTGMSVDDYVSDRLQLPLDLIESKGLFDAEQMDAIALMIYRMEVNATKDKGFINADQTGFGKGRMLAAIARYAKLSGKKTVFFTEKSSLFKDLYRDIEDIESFDLLSKPLILNDTEFVTPRGKTISNQLKKHEIARRMANGDTFDDHDLILTTYSQFNREATTDYTHAISEIDVHRANGKILEALELASKFLPSNKPLRKMKDEIASGLVIGDEKIDAMFKKVSDSLYTKSLTALRSNWIKNSDVTSKFIAVADEAHNAAGPDSNINKNLRPLITSATGVCYGSATYAKSTKNFEIFSRVFPSSINIDLLGSTLDMGGEPLQEILSSMLAADGKLIRREHDLSNIEFRLNVDKERIARNEEWSDKMAGVLTGVMMLSNQVADIASIKSEELHEAALRSGLIKDQDDHSVKVVIHSFGSKLYNLMRTFTMALNADHCAELAISYLKQGLKPVIGVENTMESVVKDLMEEHLAILNADAQAQKEFEQEYATDVVDPLEDEPEDGEIGEIKFTGEIDLGKKVSFKHILHKYVDKLFVATQVTRKGKGNVTRQPIVLDPSRLEFLEAIRREIDQLPDIPISAIDEVKEKIQAAGYTAEEISGRKLNVVTNKNGNHSIVRVQERDRNEVIDLVNSGEIDVAILSKAGSTGCSIHSSAKFADQRRRVFVELQPAAAIDTRLQFWGRVDRKGQVSSPIIQMVSSGLPAEIRLTTMQNSKLRKMSANISGNSDNSAIDESAPDILNKIGNEVCYRYLESNPQMRIRMGLKELPEEVADGDTPTFFVDALTSRLCLLEVAAQRKAYDDILTEFNAVMETYKIKGINPLSAEKYDIKAKKIKTEVLMRSVSEEDTVFNDDVLASEIEYTVTIPPSNRDDLLKKARESLERVVDERGEDYIADLVESIRDERDRIMEQILPKSYKTVAEAINDPEGNSVRSLAYKTDTLINQLRVLKPGTLIQIIDSQTLDGELALVTDIRIPDEKICAPSNYTVKFRKLSEPTDTEMTLSGLSHFQVTKITHIDDSNFNDKADSYLSQLEKEYSRDFKRVILEGNLFKAAEIAAQMGSGTTITYNDVHGAWHHAILMPRHTEMKSIMNVPVELSSGKVMYDFLTENDQVKIVSSMHRDKKHHIYEIEKHYPVTRRVKATLPVITITATAGKDACKWVLSPNSKFASRLASGFTGVRKSRRAIISLATLREFCDAFHAEAMEHKKPPIALGAREWHVKYQEKQKSEQDYSDHVTETISATPPEIKDKMK